MEHSTGDVRRRCFVWLLAAFFLWGTASACIAQTAVSIWCGSSPSTSVPCPGISALKALGYQQVTSLGSATGLPSIPTKAVIAVVTVETAGVRWRDDGTAPTATVGMPIAANGSVSFLETPLSAIQFIAQTGSPVLDVAYYGLP